ncbi:hypothetical protein FRC10_007655 [Ceratobasidium sp. 414]|nr:hypothetical protein FRC10_007655 [Ceratobasidium sp. 414]
MVDSEKTHQQPSSELEKPLLGEPAAENEKVHESSKSELAAKPHYRERPLGVWTLYYPITASWADSIPTLGSFKRAYSFVASIPTVWKFLLESISLAPLLFALYFIASVVASIVPSIHLQNNSKILNLLSRNSPVSLRYISYLYTHINPIIEQRVSLHFKKRVLEVRGRLDLTVAENPEVKSRMDKATSYNSRAWSILEGLAELMSVSIEFIGQMSVLAQMLGTREDAKLFGVVCIARPLITQMLYFGMEARKFTFIRLKNSEIPNITISSLAYYAMVTNHHWLRMNALYKLGTSSKFRKEVLSGGLDGFINSRRLSSLSTEFLRYDMTYTEYSKDMEELGDTCGDRPSSQLHRQKPFAYEDIGAVFDAIPLLLFAWGNIHHRHSDGLSLTSLVMIQQTANAFQNIIWRVTYSGRRMWGIFDNVVALYEVLDIKPAMKDGEITYPDEEHAKNEGAAIEFRRVDLYKFA